METQNVKSWKVYARVLCPHFIDEVIGAHRKEVTLVKWSNSYFFPISSDSVSSCIREEQWTTLIPTFAVWILCRLAWLPRVQAKCHFVSSDVLFTWGIPMQIECLGHNILVLFFSQICITNICKCRIVQGIWGVKLHRKCCPFTVLFSQWKFSYYGKFL